MNLQRIQDSTPVHSFPTIHNQNIEELEREIAELNRVIAEKDKAIAELKNKFNSALNTLRAEYMALYDKCVKIEDNQ